MNGRAILVTASSLCALAAVAADVTRIDADVDGGWARMMREYYWEPTSLIYSCHPKDVQKADRVGHRAENGVSRTLAQIFRRSSRELDAAGDPAVRKGEEGTRMLDAELHASADADVAGSPSGSRPERGRADVGARSHAEAGRDGGRTGEEQRSSNGGLCSCGELSLAQTMAPGFPYGADQQKILREAIAAEPFADKATSMRILHLTAAWWRWRRVASQAFAH